MQLTVCLWNDLVLNLDLDADADIDTVLAIVAAETSIPAAQQQVVFNQRPLHGQQTLRQAGVVAGDVIMILPAQAMQQQQQQGGGSRAAPGEDPRLARGPDGSAVSPVAFIAAIKADAATMAIISQNNAPLAKCIRDDNLSGLQEQLRGSHQQQQRVAEAKAAEEALAHADPFDLEAQAKIEAIIHNKNIEENYNAAYESSPEVFASVEMLYVDMEIHGVPIKAFIDSGAQMSIMTHSFAAKCHLLRLMDTRFAGMARGVGSSRILGRVHQTPLKVGGHYTTTSITVLEQNSGPQFIFGLDQLRRHACSINLRKNVLHFGSCDADVPFLPGHLIPKDFNEHIKDVSEQDADRHLQQDKAEAAASEGAAGAGPSHPPPAATADSAHTPMAVDPPAAAAAAAVPPPAAAAQPSTAGAAGGGGAGAAGPGGAADESKLEPLLALGFPRDQCIQALQATNGDVDGAAAILFGGF